MVYATRVGLRTETAKPQKKREGNQINHEATKSTKRFLSELRLWTE
jgi:hypothetical protein